MNANEPKHTPGPAHAGRPDMRSQSTVYGKWVYAGEENRYLCIVREDDDHPDETMPNARLIAEAFTVATETGLTPRQLAEQREELLAALRSLVENEDEAPSWNQRVAARAVIAKATGKETER